MAKKDEADKKSAKKSAAGTQVPEIPAEQIAHNIETVEDLEACYPQLVSAVRDEVVLQISKCSLDQVKQNMPEFYQRLVMDVQNKGGPNLNVPGFLLEVDDPVAAGTLRAYQSLEICGCLMFCPIKTRRRGLPWRITSCERRVAAIPKGLTPP